MILILIQMNTNEYNNINLLDNINLNGEEERSDINNKINNTLNSNEDNDKGIPIKINSSELNIIYIISNNN